LPLGEFIRTTPDNLFFLHLIDDDLQNKQLHHLSRDGGEADWPVVPWVLLLALFEDWSDTGFSPVLQDFSKMIERGSANDICQLPQYSWGHSMGAYGFVGGSLLGLTLCSITQSSCRQFSCRVVGLLT